MGDTLTPAPPSTFGVFTTVRYDPGLEISAVNQDLCYPDVDKQKGCGLYMFRYHKERLEKAATHFKFDNIAQLGDGLALQRRVEQCVNEAKEKEPHYRAFRIRVTVLADGKTYGLATGIASWTAPHIPIATFFPIELDQSFMSTPPSWTIQIDSIPTTQNAHTHFKTTTRAQYEAASSRHANVVAINGTMLEVLVANSKCLVTEGTITTPYFLRKGRWVTPFVVLGEGGQEGTTRKWALEKLGVLEADVYLDTVTVGEKVWLSNGARGFGWGVVQPFSFKPNNSGAEITKKR